MAASRGRRNARRIASKSLAQTQLGQAILATSSLFARFSLAAFQEVWNEFVTWKRFTEPTLLVEDRDRLFKTAMNGETIWVIEDDAVFTILFPSEY